MTRPLNCLANIYLVLLLLARLGARCWGHKGKRGLTLPLSCLQTSCGNKEAQTLGRPGTGGSPELAGLRRGCPRGGEQVSVGRGAELQGE